MLVQIADLTAMEVNPDGNEFNFDPHESLALSRAFGPGVVEVDIVPPQEIIGSTILAKCQNFYVLGLGYPDPEDDTYENFGITWLN